MPIGPDRPPAQLSVTVQPDGNLTRFVAVGEIDTSTAEQFKQSLDAALDQHPATLCVDLAGVTFLDSTGIGALAHALHRAAQDHVRLTVAKTPAGTSGTRSQRPADAVD